MSETVTMTLTDFWLARIAEDEAAAQAAGWHAGVKHFERDNYGQLLANPARVLAECEAKRRIVERHRNCDDVSFGDDSTCPDLRDLAAAYADHPDYREEWKP